MRDDKLWELRKAADDVAKNLRRHTLDCSVCALAARRRRPEERCDYGYAQLRVRSRADKALAAYREECAHVAAGQDPLFTADEIAALSSAAGQDREG